MDILFVVTILCVLLIFNWIRYRDVLAPAVIHNILWILLIILYNLSDIFPRLSVQTLTMIVLSVSLFSIGSFIATYKHQIPKMITCIKGIPNIISLKIMFALIIIVLPVFILTSLSNALTGPFANYFQNMRYMAVYGPGFGLFGYIVPLGMVLAGSHMVMLCKFNSRKYIISALISIVVALIFAVLSTGRTFTFSLVIMLAFIYILTHRHKTITTGLLVIGSMLLLFFINGILKIGGSLSNPLPENIALMYESFKVYLLGPLAAFDYAIMPIRSVDFTGPHVFRTFNAILAAMGHDIYVVNLVRDFVYFPLKINVYTVFELYFIDYSWLGVIMSQFSFGLWHGFLYRKVNAAEPKAKYVLLHAIFMYPLFMQFFHDQYMSLMSQWIQVLFWVNVGWFPLKMRMSRKKRSLLYRI